MGFKYQIALVGLYSPVKEKIRDAVFKQLDALGVDRDRLTFIEETEMDDADPKAPLVAIFIGYTGAVDASHTCISKLITDSATIVPCTSTIEKATAELPLSLRHINAFSLNGGDERIDRLATLILENLHLLRLERRLFISYRRKESQPIAVQLYESFDAAGFDVFLDTRSVPYAVDFQGVLWHRMADSDIVVLLDTPEFRSSPWTEAEQARANATNIQILHLLWPGVKSDKSSAFSEFVLLERSDFKGRTRIGDRARLSAPSLQAIVSRAESLRARALAARHRSLIDNFCDRAREAKAASITVQPERFIAVELSAGKKVAVVPTIGIPRADRYQDIEKAIRATSASEEQVWLLYDERGVLESWLAHIEWLNNHLPVAAVQISRCSDRLREGVQ